MLLENQHLKWKQSIVNEIFLPFEAAQILSIPLPTHARQDKFIWGETINGEFSVRSAYKLIKRLNDIEEEPSILDPSRDQCLWKKLWRLNVPPKTMHFVWRIYKGTLLIRQKLLRRGVRLDPTCSTYRTEEELIEHALRDCNWVKIVWRKSLLQITLHDETQQPIKHWFQHLIDKL